MKKLLLIPGVLGLILLSACVPMPSGNGDSSSSSSESADARVIEVDVTAWSFSPSTINIRKGEKVIVRLTGGTGNHSFGVTDLGINVAVGPGETKDVMIPTDAAGTFDFRCMIPCGTGHLDMKGTIVIS